MKKTCTLIGDLNAQISAMDHTLMVLKLDTLIRDENISHLLVSGLGSFGKETESVCHIIQERHPQLIIEQFPAKDKAFSIYVKQIGLSMDDDVSKIEDYHVRYLVDNADYVLCHTQADSGMSLKGIALAKERNKTIVEWK
ncbi:MAG: hypothetical protein IJC11_07245 [Alphaproteobacteria bacterium]|nr:hypothetical protein [Alphaproteobacteria bacterium]